MHKKAVRLSFACYKVFHIITNKLRNYMGCGITRLPKQKAIQPEYNLRTNDCIEERANEGNDDSDVDANNNQDYILEKDNSTGQIAGNHKLSSELASYVVNIDPHSGYYLDVIDSSKMEAVSPIGKGKDCNESAGFTDVCNLLHVRHQESRSARGAIYDSLVANKCANALKLAGTRYSATNVIRNDKMK